MIKNKILIFSIVGLFLLTCLPSISIIGMKTNNNNNDNNYPTIFDEYDAEAPVWEVGNSWTFDVTIFGGIPGAITLSNIRMSDLTFTVDEVHNETYTLSFSSSITGSATVDLDIIKLSGNFLDTDMSGILIVNKTTCTINETQDFLISGYIKPNILPKIPFSISGGIFYTYYGNTLVNFPFNNYESWVAHEITMALDFAVNLLPDPVQGVLTVEGHLVECLEWDIVTVSAGEFDALKLNSALGDEHTVWYSVAAGNVVKMTGRDIPFNWGYAGEYYVDIKLKSTNYEVESDPPSTPTSITGPSEVTAGYPQTYTAGGSTDPDGHIIRYIFDWGDGKQTGTDFVDSGQSASLDYFWTKKGTYNVKVKARDKYGAQSDWSDTFTVTVLNDPPLKPDPPNGPSHGYWRRSHTYTATTTDPDYHRVRFQFDWGDGKKSYSNYVESGGTGSASHRWSWPNNYRIKVKAIDEYGEDSEWSEPIEVTIPRSRTFNRPFLNFLQILFERLGLK